MEEKKHKGGYELLKEKYAKLEAEHVILQRKSVTSGRQSMCKQKQPSKTLWTGTTASRRNMPL